MFLITVKTVLFLTKINKIYCRTLYPSFAILIIVSLKFFYHPVWVFFHNKHESIYLC